MKGKIVKKKILVVDDDPTSLKAVAAVLTSNGYEVKASAHAEDIEKTVKDFNPQLIVMDLIMPNVDGNQAIKRLQKDPLLNRIPVVFLTAINFRDERGVEFEISVNDRRYRTLTKPFNAKALVAEIEELMK